jgi:hypothetical protein
MALDSIEALGFRYIDFFRHGRAVSNIPVTLVTTTKCHLAAHRQS